MDGAIAEPTTTRDTAKQDIKKPSDTRISSVPRSTAKGTGKRAGYISAAKQKVVCLSDAANVETGDTCALKTKF